MSEYLILASANLSSIWPSCVSIFDVMFSVVRCQQQLPRKWLASFFFSFVTNELIFASVINSCFWSNMNHSGSTKQRFENVVVVCPLALNWFRKTRTEMAAGVVMMVCTLHHYFSSFGGTSMGATDNHPQLCQFTQSIWNYSKCALSARVFERVNVDKKRLLSWHSLFLSRHQTESPLSLLLMFTLNWLRGLKESNNLHLDINSSAYWLVFHFYFWSTKIWFISSKTTVIVLTVNSVSWYANWMSNPTKKTGPVTAGKILETSQCLAWPSPLTERRVKTSQLRMFLL